MFKKSKISVAVLVALSGSMTSIAMAQNAMEQVVITGSNLKRADKEGTSPVLTITAQEIQQSGATTVLQLLKSVPSLGVGGYNDTQIKMAFQGALQRHLCGPLGPLQL